MALSSNGLAAIAEVAKQVITLSIGVIGLTVTFLKDIVGAPAGGGSIQVPWLLAFAWGCYLIAVLGGLATLLAVSGSINALDRKDNGLPLDASQQRAVDHLVYAPNVRIPLFGLVAGFLLGTTLIIATVLVR